MRRAAWAAVALIAVLSVLAVLRERRRPVLRVVAARVSSAYWTGRHGHVAGRQRLGPGTVRSLAVWLSVAPTHAPAAAAAPCVAVRTPRVVLEQRGGVTVVTGPVILCGPSGHRTSQVLVTVDGRRTLDLNAPHLAEWLVGLSRRLPDRERGAPGAATDAPPRASTTRPRLTPGAPPGGGHER